MADLRRVVTEKDDAATIMAKHVQPRLDLQAAVLRRHKITGETLALTNEDICGLSHFLLFGKPLFNELVVRSSEMVEAQYAQLAKELGMHITASYFKRYGDLNYNLVSVFDKNGKIVGEYRKTHIPPSEMWHLADGDDLNIIDLGFVRLGVLICYDMMFPEAASVLALQNAEVILHPTGGYGWYDAIGEATLKVRANDSSAYILTAKNAVNNGAGKSSIIDPWGHVLADAGFYPDVLVSATIDLDRKKEQPSWFYPSQMSGYADIRERYPLERRPELYGAVAKPAKRLPTPNEAQREVLRKKVESGECRW